MKGCFARRQAPASAAASAAAGAAAPTQCSLRPPPPAALSRRAQRAHRLRAAPAARTASIEHEEYTTKAPATLLRSGSEGGMRAAFESMVRAKQDEICAAVSALDGTPFREDAWTRPGGGGGISRVLQGGNVFEKAGVNVSVVYGTMPPDAYRAATGDAGKAQAGPVPFFAAGISSVMHPHNPMAPTMHFNYRYFETDAPSDSPGAPRAWWFGGGTDLTPSYLFKDDVTHFHRTYKDVCDAHDPAFYGRFKQWADDYFVNKHRGERRGLGGIFFDDMNDRPAEKLLAFATDAAAAVVPSYLPIVAKRKDEAFTDKQREWQQLRRGRYGAHAAAA